jgi:hypothetical protein
MLCHWWGVPSVSKDHSAFNFRVKQSKQNEYTCNLLEWAHRSPPLATVYIPLPTCSILMDAGVSNFCLVVPHFLSVIAYSYSTLEMRILFISIYKNGTAIYRLMQPNSETCAPIALKFTHGVQLNSTSAPLHFSNACNTSKTFKTSQHFGV